MQWYGKTPACVKVKENVSTGRDGRPNPRPASASRRSSS